MQGDELELSLPLSLLQAVPFVGFAGPWPYEQELEVLQSPAGPLRGVLHVQFAELAFDRLERAPPPCLGPKGTLDDQAVDLSGRGGQHEKEF